MNDTQSTAIVQAEQSTTIPDIPPEIQLPENSIYHQPQFPSHTKVFSFTPATVLKMLIEYAKTTTALNVLCDKYGIRWTTFWQLGATIPEIRATYVWARETKAPLIAGSAHELYEQEPPETCYQIDKYGNRQLSVAGVRWLENKANMRMRMAEIAESGRINSRQEIQVTSQNLNLNANINVSPDTNPGDLLAALRGLSAK